MTVCPLLFISSTMIFSSSGRSTWGTHSFRTAAYTIHTHTHTEAQIQWGSLIYGCISCWTCTIKEGIREAIWVYGPYTNAHLWWSGAGWLPCSTPQSPSVSERPPPERPCLPGPEIIGIIKNTLRGFIQEQVSGCRTWVGLFKEQDTIMENKYIQIIRIAHTALMRWTLNYIRGGLAMWTLFRIIHVKNGQQRPQVWTFDTSDNTLTGSTHLKTRLDEMILYWLLIIWSTCTKFDEIPSRCSWAITITIGRTDEHIGPHITYDSKILVLLFLIWTSSSEGFRSFFLLPGRNFFMGRGLLLESWRSATQKVSTSLSTHKHAYTHTATHTCKAKAPNQTECKAYKDAHPSRTNNIEEQKNSINKQGSKHVVMTVTEPAGSRSVLTSILPEEARRTTTTKKNPITFNSGYFRGSSHMKNIADYTE